MTPLTVSPSNNQLHPTHLVVYTKRHAQVQKIIRSRPERTTKALEHVQFDGDCLQGEEMACCQRPELKSHKGVMGTCMSIHHQAADLGQTTN